MTNLSLVAAAKFELGPAIRILRERGLETKSHVCGIGALAAAKAAARVADQVRGNHCIFIGTCGLFGSFSGVRLVRIDRVFWLPACARQGLAYTVEGTDLPYDLPVPHRTLQHIPSATLIASPCISLSGSLPPSFSGGLCVENLELYSCAAELAASSQSFTALLAITNSVSPDAHVQWMSHKDEAAQLLAQTLGCVMASGEL